MTRAEEPLSLLPKSADRSTVVASSGQVTSRLVSSGAAQDAAALEVAIAAGADNYPGAAFKPSGKTFDLSAFGHVEARLVNTGDKPLSIALRVDNDGPWQDEPWNTESVELQPGETKSVRVTFGYQYGGKPGYALKSSAVSQLLLFTGKADAAASFRVLSLFAAGTPGEGPAVPEKTQRLVPKDGRLFAVGDAFDLAKQFHARDAVVTSTADGLSVVVPANKRVLCELQPPTGAWDLGGYRQVAVTIKNVGPSPLTASPQLMSTRGPTHSFEEPGPIAPGASATWVISFDTGRPIDLASPGEWTSFVSDAVTKFHLYVTKSAAEQRFVITSVVTQAPPAVAAEWLGKRPPIEGNWTRTLDENFEGKALDEKVWSTGNENWWDPKKTHFSKDQIILADGVARLRYEKKTGRNNDKPDGAETPYASAYLHTFGKFAQRYGYFEARLKVPTAPGLWPAFWMMPDRGKDFVGDRGGTGEGGMEFDVMEMLTRWGPYRYNVAQHWDGYGKEHQSVGTDLVYADADKDGYMTVGLLWLPGEATYYCNGKAVARWKNARVGSVPCHLIFYMPSGGWDNNATDDQTLPADFVIDYVRVWQRADLAGEPAKR